MLIAQLQRRIARLLLRHDRHTFRGQFRELYIHSMLPQPQILREYDRYIRLVALAEDLFNDILPRIRRQLSFHATRIHLHEEAPLRGDIDWGRSLQRSWVDHPDQQPIRFQTTLRRRTFATPENKLVIAILHWYANSLATIRQNSLFVDDPLNTREQRHIAQLEDHVRRELASTQFQELSHEVGANQVSEFIEHVAPKVRRGTNPYGDLIAWWERSETLHFHLHADQHSTRALTSRTQLEVLYQLWLALELIDFLGDDNLLSNCTITTNNLTFDFNWQDRPFRLVYNRQSLLPLAWQNVPSNRPDYFITRADAYWIKDGETTIWHEPCVILDATCTIDDSLGQAAASIKRLLADMQLTDTYHGALILPDRTGFAEHIFPKTDRYLGNINQEAELRVFDVRPLEDLNITRSKLRSILDHAALWLPVRPDIACYGRWADRDTLNPDRTKALPLNNHGEPLIFCPKPHISLSTIDLVNPYTDCLKNPRLCHIMGTRDVRSLLPPFVRRVLNQEELRDAIAMLRTQLNQQFSIADKSAEAETARTILLEAIGELVDTYRKFRQPDLRHIEDKLGWIFTKYWNDVTNPRSLPPKVRDMLISGEFVWNEFHNITVEDWAACAVQYVRAIEHEFQRRLYARCGGANRLQNRYQKPLQIRDFTFGTVKSAYDNRANQHNWKIFVTYAAQASGTSEHDFTTVISTLISLHQLRNEIAHSYKIDQSQATFIRTITLGDPNTASFGALPRFVELLDA